MYCFYTKFLYFEYISFGLAIFQMLNSHLGLAAPVEQPRSKLLRPMRAQPAHGHPQGRATSCVYERYARHHQLSMAACHSPRDPTQCLTRMVLDRLSNNSHSQDHHNSHSQDHRHHAYRHQKVWGLKESFPWRGKSCASGHTPLGPSPN